MTPLTFHVARTVFGRALLVVLVALAGPLGCESGREEPRAMAPADLSAAQAAGEVVLVDVRTPAEFEAGHIPGAWNVPVDQVAARVEEIRARASDAELVLYCQSGRRAAIAAGALQAAGVTGLRHLDGDYGGWAAAGLPVEAGSGGP